MPMQCDTDVAAKALLKVVRCNCKIGCDTALFLSQSGVGMFQLLWRVSRHLC